MMNTKVFSSFTLPSGGVLKNRLVKAAMEENLANKDLLPDKHLFNLYHAWAQGGVGLIITGNVMIDHLAMTGPGGLALEKDSELAPFQKLASIAKQNETQIWMQINHPGRQVFKKLGGKALSASNIALDMGKHSTLFAQPKAMSEDEIQDVIQRFTITARRAKEAGFDGVEIHAAHGYLIAQFLSPLTNKRTDQWGGSLENRARLLLDVVKAVRKACGNDFALAIKLNSADFQRGGFDIDDAIKVVSMLEPLSIDMIELSGGSYEAPAMQGQTADQRTLSREAYFLEFAANVAKNTRIPVMTTGGIKRLAVASAVIDSGVELVGMASALAFNPALANSWQKSGELIGTVPVVQWQDKTLSSLANMALVKRQFRLLAANKSVKLNASAIYSLIVTQWHDRKLTRRYRKRFAGEVK